MVVYPERERICTIPQVRILVYPCSQNSQRDHQPAMLATNCRMPRSL